MCVFFVCVHPGHATDRTRLTLQAVKHSRCLAMVSSSLLACWHGHVDRCAPVTAEAKVQQIDGTHLDQVGGAGHQPS